MTAAERLKKIEASLAELNIRMAGAGGGTSHNLLSATHPDTDPDSPVAGDILRGIAGPEWQRLAKGNDAEVLTLAGGLPTWQPGGGGAGAMVFEDTFADASLHWAWTTYGTGATRTITEAGGIITIHVDAAVTSYFYTSSNSAPTMHIDAPQFPCTIETKIDFDGAVPNLCEFGIFASCRSIGGVSNGCWIFGRRRLDASGQNGLYANRWGTEIGNINPMLTLPIWLRIRVGGGHRTRSTAYFDYSTDGITYNNITSDSNSGQYPGTYGFTHGLYVRNWSPGPYPQIDAEFEYFKMTLSEGPG